MRTNQNSEGLKRGKKEWIDVDTAIGKYPNMKNWSNQAYLSYIGCYSVKSRKLVSKLTHYYDLNKKKLVKSIICMENNKKGSNNV